MGEKIAIAALLVLLVGSMSVMAVKYHAKAAELNNENKQLREQIEEQKKEAEGKEAGSLSLLEERQEKETKEQEEKEGTEAEEKLIELTDTFLTAGFEYTNDGDRVKHMEPYMTEKMSEVYQNPAFSGDGNTARCAGRIREKAIYQVREGNGKAVSVSRVTYVFQAEGQEEIVNDALVELTFSEQLDGTYLVDSQKMYTLVE